MKPNVILKLTSAIVVAGQVIKPPALVEMTDSEARNLLHRGKAVVATEADGVASAVTDTVAGALNPELPDFEADAAARLAEDLAEAEAEDAARAAAAAEAAEAATAAADAEKAAADAAEKAAADGAEKIAADEAAAAAAEKAEADKADAGKGRGRNRN